MFECRLTLEVVAEMLRVRNKVRQASFVTHAYSRALAGLPAPATGLGGLRRLHHRRRVFGGTSHLRHVAGLRCVYLARNSGGRLAPTRLPLAVDHRQKR